MDLIINGAIGQRIDEAAQGKFELITLTASETAALTSGAGLRTVNGARNIVLGEKIVHNARGREGGIYRCSESDCAVKLYSDVHRDTRKEKKLRDMIKMQNFGQGICWPKDVLTYNRKFVGFLMPMVSGEQLSDILFQSAQDEDFATRMPKYDRRFQVDMILGILKLFRELHEKGILVGDINTRKIMVDPNDASKVTFVDMDRVQFSVYNCPSTTFGYDSPEVILQNGREGATERTEGGVFKFTEHYSRCYRTWENEYYAIAVLLHKIMMPDCAPYSVSDRNGSVTDEEALARCADSVYPYSADQTAMSPDKTAWYSVWSHFPSFLKEAFANVFSSTRKRYTVDEWTEIFRRYKTILENGELEAVDPLCYQYAQAEPIEFEKTEFILSSQVELSGFSFEQIIRRIGVLFKDALLDEKAGEIADGLKLSPVFEIGKYRFELIYNMGVLKKIRCKSF